MDSFSAAEHKGQLYFLFRREEAATVEQLLFLLASSGKNEYIQEIIIFPHELGAVVNHSR